MKLWTLLFLGGSLYASEALDSKKIDQWQIAPMSGISSFVKKKDTFYELPVTGDYYYEVPYHSNPSQGDLAFGTKKSLSGGMKKTSLEFFGMKQKKWAGIELIDEKLIFFESWNYRVFYRDLKTGDFSRLGQMFIDAPTPASDDRGKASKLESDRSKRKFRRGLKNMDFPYEGLIGISRFGKKESKRNEGAQFIALTGVKDFPLVTVKCNLGGEPSCVYLNTCFGDLDQMHQGSGIFFDQASRKIYISYKDKREIKVFNYNSCYHVTSDSTIKLPNKLPVVSDIHVDEDGKLWTSLVKKDQYMSAILMRWKTKFRL